MIYKIRIILDAEDDIFRDIELEDNGTLEDFHNIITQAFGFMGDEMASFYTCDTEWNQDEEIALFDMSESGSDVQLMNETALDDVLNEKSPKLIYVYDFFKMWTFFIELADIVEKEDGRPYPNVLFSFGELPDSPPEKKFEAEPGIEFDDSFGSYDDLDFDENWN
ncbi:MAG: hypothetical protein HKP38_11315 [Croceitalea sp.]|nr:plasmid pRiA4b ORF-3 family protein [Croceitalea sp.]MBT8238085.1 plasmid pRiA4b ORF-3 family protein [Croceitalea sp.]NNC34510.1 hypothetical protein [Croceitalea sp.]NNL09801.1 hypothetical protein [Croceitalea sp.]NNM19430.1 hypothetical protein [Croceitalea sp.]